MNKIINSFLVFGLLMSSFVGVNALEDTNDLVPEIEAINVDENHKPSISEFLIYEDVKKEYLNHEEISFYVKVKLGSNVNVSNDITIDIKLPKDVVDQQSIVTTDMEGQKSIDIIEDEESIIVRYIFTSIIEGVSMDIPIKFKSTQGATPHNYQLDVSASIKNSSGDDILDPIRYDFSLINNKQNLDFIVNNSANPNKSHLGGIESSVNPGHLSDVLEDLDFVALSFAVESEDYKSKLGTRNIEKIVVEQKLPEEAVFVQDANEGWIYDEVSHTALYTKVYESALNLGRNNFENKIVLNLKFPGVKAKKSIPLHTIVELHAENAGVDEAPVVLSKGRTLKLTAKKSLNFEVGKKSHQSSLLDTLSNRKEAQTWTINVDNDLKSTGNITSVKMSDQLLNSRGYVSKVIFKENADVTGTFNIKGILNNQEVLLMEGIDGSKASTYTIENPEVYSTVIIESDNTNLKPGTSLSVDVETLLRNPEEPIVKNAKTQVYQNKVTVDVKYGSVSAGSKSYTSQILFHKFMPQLWFNDTIANVKENYTPYESIENTVQLKGAHLQDELDTLTLDKIIVLLPEGMEYRKGSSSLSVAPYVEHNDLELGKVEPEVIHNYEHTKQVALVYHLDTIKNTDNSDRKVSILDLGYKTYFTEHSEKGANDIQTYLIWDKHEDIEVKTTERNSPFSNQGDALYDEKTVNFMPAKELVLRKEVKGTLDDAYQLAPSKASSEFGKTVDFRLTLLNNSVDDVDTIHVLDLLPNLGDKTISEDISLNGERVSRESTLRLTLEGPLVAPEGYKVFYNTQDMNDDVKAYYRSNAWQSSVDDYSAVKAIKIVLEDNHILKSEDHVSFEMSMSVPSEMNDLTLNKAVNSFGAATTDQLVFFESNFATVDIHDYSIDGHVFFDSNKDGLFDRVKESVKKAHLIELIDEEGMPVKDLNGDVITALTDDKGYFKFRLPHAGAYRIKVSIPEGYDATKILDHIDGSAIDTEGFSSFINLNKNQKHVTLNAGFRIEEGSLQVSKTLKDALNHEFVNEQDFEFKVSINNLLYTRYATVIDKEGNQETVEVLDGVLKLKAKETFVIENIDKGSTYTVEEVAHQGYEAEETTYSGTINENLIDINYINHVIITKTNVEVSKVWEDDFDIHPDIQVQLYRNGEKHLEPITLTDDNLVYTWIDLDAVDQYGEAYVYTVDELTVLDNYKKTIDGSIITNTFIKDDVLITPNPDVSVPTDETPKTETPSIDNPTVDKNNSAQVELKTPKTGLQNKVVLYGNVLLLMSLMLIVLRSKKSRKI